MKLKRILLLLLTLTLISCNTATVSEDTDEAYESELSDEVEVNETINLTDLITSGKSEDTNIYEHTDCLYFFESTRYHDGQYHYEDSESYLEYIENGDYPYFSYYLDVGTALETYITEDGNINVAIVGSAFGAHQDFLVSTYEDEIWLTAYWGEGGDVVIPNGVTRICASSFMEYPYEITSIYIPDSVTVIESNAFATRYRDDTLKEVRMSSNIEYIGYNAFGMQTALEKVYFDELPDHTVIIDNHAFAGCSSLTEFQMPESFLLGENVFLPQSYWKSYVSYPLSDDRVPLDDIHEKYSEFYGTYTGGEYREAHNNLETRIDRQVKPSTSGTYKIYIP